MFKGMHYVYEVYKESSFSKAAKNLFISQPSLSADIKKIEQQLGFEIFDRSTSPIRLTEHGREYIRSVEKIMEIEAGFENFINDLEDLKSGSISIGGTNFFASFILPPLILQFSKKYPRITINLVETNTSMLEKQLNEGALDLVIDNCLFDPAVYGRQFFSREQLVLAVPRKFDANVRAMDYRLSVEDIKAGKHLGDGMEPVPLELFKKEAFLFLKEGNDTRRRAEIICRHSEFRPQITLMLDQQITAYNLTCYGMGISFISDSMVKNVKPDDNVIFYKLDNRDSARDVCLYYKSGRYMTKAAKEFLKIAVSCKI